MLVDDDDIHERRAVTRTLKDQEIHDIIRSTVHETLLSLGLDTSDPIKLQKDFQHLRDWREASEFIKMKGVLTLVIIAVTGGASLFWVGIKRFIEDLSNI